MGVVQSKILLPLMKPPGFKPHHEAASEKYEEVA